MCDCKAFPPGACPCAKASKASEEFFRALDDIRQEPCDCHKCDPEGWTE